MMTVGLVFFTVNQCIKKGKLNDDKHDIHVHVRVYSYSIPLLLWLFTDLPNTLTATTIVTAKSTVAARLELVDSIVCKNSGNSMRERETERDRERQREREKQAEGARSYSKQIKYYMRSNESTTCIYENQNLPCVYGQNESRNNGNPNDCYV